MRKIAVDGLTLAHASGSVISGGVFTITSVPETGIKFKNDSGSFKGVFQSPLKFSFSGGTASGFVPGSVQTTVVASMNTTTLKVQKKNGAKLMCKGDSVMMVCVGTLPPPAGGTAPVSGMVEISDAKQTKGGAN